MGITPSVPTTYFSMIQGKNRPPNVFVHLIDTASNITFSIETNRFTVDKLDKNLKKHANNGMAQIQEQKSAIECLWTKYKENSLDEDSLEHLAGATIAYHLLSPMLDSLKEKYPGLFGYTFYILLYPSNRDHSVYYLRCAGDIIKKRSNSEQLLEVRQYIMTNDLENKFDHYFTFIHQHHPELFT